MFWPPIRSWYMHQLMSPRPYLGNARYRRKAVGTNRFPHCVQQYRHVTYRVFQRLTPPPGINLRSATSCAVCDSALSTLLWQVGHLAARSVTILFGASGFRFVLTIAFLRCLPVRANTLSRW